MAWDDAVVPVLEKQLEVDNPEATARKLEALYPAAGDVAAWKPGESERIAWESHEVAESDVYGALGIPERACEMDACDPATRTPVALAPAYMERARGRLSAASWPKAGRRLATLLDQIWSFASPDRECLHNALGPRARLNRWRSGLGGTYCEDFGYRNKLWNADRLRKLAYIIADRKQAKDRVLKADGIEVLMGFGVRPHAAPTGRQRHSLAILNPGERDEDTLLPEEQGSVAK